MFQCNRIPTDRVMKKLDEHLGRNDYVSAKRHLHYWLAEAESLRDDNGILLINNELMGLFRKLGEKEPAMAHAQKALDLIKRMNIEENVGAATTYLNCATVYKAFGQAQEAISLFERARAIYEANLSPQDTRLGGLYNNMALALVDLKRFEEADELYCKALEVMQRNEGREPELAITYLNIATAAEMHFGLEEAKEVIEECAKSAMHLLEISKERTDGDYAFVCEKCAPVFGYYGYADYEKVLTERCRRAYERT